MNVSKIQSLKRVAQDLLKAPCPLRPGATQPVAGEGNPNAEILFLGEAPGAKEDLSGRPFVGAAGKVLDELLQSIRLKRKDVFITSIEKFRPPKNRDPKREEILACFPYLERQIKTINPTVIVCLGRHALRRMLEWEAGHEIKEKLPMEEYRGKVIKGKRGRRYFTVYHPAAALYGFSREEMKKDFKKLKKLLV